MMSTYSRPLKDGGNRQYVDEVASGFTKLPARELDDDLNVLYNAVNRPMVSATISTSPPAAPIAGQIWWRSDDGQLYVYYDDGTSLQWVAANTR